MAGRERDPDWAGNLRAEPKASVNRAKYMFEVTAHELSGGARERAWKLVVETFSDVRDEPTQDARQIRSSP